MQYYALTGELLAGIDVHTHLLGGRLMCNTINTVDEINSYYISILPGLLNLTAT